MSIGLFCSLLYVKSIALFMPSLVATMGLDKIKSQLLTVPPYAVDTMCCIPASMSSDRYKIRGPTMVCFTGPFVDFFYYSSRLRKQWCTVFCYFFYYGWCFYGWFPPFCLDAVQSLRADG